jgi:hypothetical protein
MISSEPPEIFGLTDRLRVLFEGRPAATPTNAKTTREEILPHAAGVAASIDGDGRAADQKFSAVGEQP